MTLLEAALAYARLGWHVFPCEPPRSGDDSSGKRPIGSLVVNGKDDATTDPRTIEFWWAQCPQANIGIACEPSGLVCLDIDSKNGAKGFDSLNEFAHELPDTLKQKTGSGALHAIYLRGDAQARQSLGVRDGIDIIGKGYFIAAPSVHYSGESYQWINTIAPVQQPEILKTIVRQGKSKREPLKQGQRSVMIDEASKIVAASLIADAFPAKGSRHAARLALCGSLAQEGWDEESISEFVQMVCKLIGSPAHVFDVVAAQARDSVAKVANGEEVAGWGSLSSHIPQDVLSHVQERLGMVSHELDWVKQQHQQGAINLLALGADQYIQQQQAQKPAIQWIGELAARKYPPVVSYPTQFPELNELLGGGISTQQLAILLGKPGAGKTAFYVSLMLHLCQFTPVLYVSTELQHNELVARIASPLVKAPWRDIVRGKACNHGSPITEKQLGELLARHAIAIIAQDDIYAAGDRAVELIAKTAQAIAEQTGKKPIVMVDYLQELARGDDTKARQQNTKIAVAFRMLSQHYDCAFFAVSSVSRAGYGKAAAELRQADNPEVYLALAKESGDIDYAAATIMFLDVSDERDGNGWKMARMAVAKSRHGETGFAGMRFHGAYGLWEPHSDGVKALSEESRSGARAERQINDLESRVLRKVQELAMLAPDANGLTQLKTKTELKVLVGGNSMQAGIAIDKLIREGKLIEQVETYQHPVTKKLTTRKVIGLPPAGFTPPAPETPLDIGATLAGIVGATKA